MMSDPDTSIGERNCALVRDLLRRIAARDIAGALELYTDDAVVEFPFMPPGLAARHEGKAVIGRFLAATVRRSARIALEDVRTEALARPDRVLAEYRGDWELADGRPYRNTYITIFEVRDGRIHRTREFFNPLVVLEASGAEAGGRHTDRSQAGDDRSTNAVWQRGWRSALHVDAKHRYKV